MKRLVPALGLLIASLSSPLAAQILPPGATPVQLTTGYGFTEGPLDDGAGGVLFTNLTFGNLNGSDIYRYDLVTGQTQLVDGNSGGANGLYLDAGGQVVAMEGGRKRVTRRALGNVAVVDEVLATQWNGDAFNSPNDVVIDASGGIYFTDPDYNNQFEQPEGVYYLDEAGTVNQILTGFNRPNGIALSPDGRTLYLAAEGAGERRIMAYDIDDLGQPTGERVFARTDVNGQGDPLPGINNGPDGITVDPFGNLYAAVQNNVFAWDPQGNRLFDLAVPENPTNVEVGGPSGETLFITARTSLYSVELNLPEILAGDFNRDGAVDAADYTEWRDHLGFGYTQGDYQVWADHFGEMAPAQANGSSVPEPAAVLLAGLAIAWRAAGARRRLF